MAYPVDGRTLSQKQYIEAAKQAGCTVLTLDIVLIRGEDTAVHPRYLVRACNGENHHYVPLPYWDDDDILLSRETIAHLNRRLGLNI